MVQLLSVGHGVFSAAETSDSTLGAGNRSQPASQPNSWPISDNAYYTQRVTGCFRWIYADMIS
jgi:hypothetical protein